MLGFLQLLEWEEGYARGDGLCASISSQVQQRHGVKETWMSKGGDDLVDTEQVPAFEFGVEDELVWAGEPAQPISHLRALQLIGLRIELPVGDAVFVHYLLEVAQVACEVAALLHFIILAIYQLGLERIFVHLEKRLIKPVISRELSAGRRQAEIAGESHYQPSSLILGERADGGARQKEGDIYVNITRPAPTDWDQTDDGRQTDDAHQIWAGRLGEGSM